MVNIETIEAVYSFSDIIFEKLNEKFDELENEFRKINLDMNIENIEKKTRDMHELNNKMALVEEIRSMLISEKWKMIDSMREVSDESK